MLNSIFNSISVILLRSVVFVEKTGKPEKCSLKQSLTNFIAYSMQLYSVNKPHHKKEITLTTIAAIGTDCVGGCK